jgi:hypothetical protein
VKGFTERSPVARVTERDSASIFAVPFGSSKKIRDS